MIHTAVMTPLPHLKKINKQLVNAPLKKQVKFNFTKFFEQSLPLGPGPLKVFAIYTYNYK